MTETGRKQGSLGRPRAILALVGTALGVLGVVAVTGALVDQTPSPPQPSGPDTSPGRPTTHRPPSDGGDRGGSDHSDAATAGRGLDYSRPLRLSIPAIGVTSTLEHLELDDNGVMETPVDPSRAGWFTPSPPPGVPGVSVLAGHVTWDREPAVFFRLGELRHGDPIEIGRADGSTAVFTVDRLGIFKKESFPTAAVYGQTDYPSLRLITCGGAFDEQTHNYRANLIVWASFAPQGDPPATIGIPRRFGPRHQIADSQIHRRQHIVERDHDGRSPSPRDSRRPPARIGSRR